MQDRADANAQTIWNWLEKRDWVDNLCEVDAQRSNTGVCLKIVDPRIKILMSLPFCLGSTGPSKRKYRNFDGTGKQQYDLAVGG